MLPFTKYELKKMIEQKYVSAQKHPEADLYIYNYTQNAQFDNVWNNVTLNCRGLILDGDFNVVARPFKKFFNYEEYLEKPHLQGQIPTNEIPHMFLKYDGSMGIMYWLDNKPYIATRGSFVSEQAIRGTKILHEKYPEFMDIDLRSDVTILFEIIYPENRIVVDYQDREDLIQLAIIDNETGRTSSNDYLGFPRAEEFRNVKLLSLDEIKQLDYNNQEGFVCYYPQADFRMKIKFQNYLQLHRIMTGVSSISLWEYLKDGKDIDEIIGKVPDEFYEWVKKTVRDIRYNYMTVQELAGKYFDNLYESRDGELPERKEYAEWVKTKDKPLWSILFAMYDKKDYSQMIWKLIRPNYEQPFKNKIEEN